MSLSYNSIFLLNDGTVRSVGNNDFGQCGMVNNISPLLTLQQLNVTGVKQISSGNYHTIFLLQDGTVRTVGYNEYGQCGTGNVVSPQIDLYKPNIEGVEQVACGLFHSVFLLKDGTVRIAGNNEYGQCGTYDNVSPQMDLYKPNISNVIQVACGAYHTVFLINDGTVRLIGKNDHGQCATGNTVSPQLSIYQPNISNIKQVVCGSDHTVFLLNDGTIRTMGSNINGQCGTGNTSMEQLNIYQPNINNVKQVSCGSDHTVFLLEDGSVRTVGYNKYGQCVTGNTEDPQLNFYQPNINNVKQITCGSYHTILLMEDGTVRTAGNNESGQCITGNTISPQLSIYQPDISNVQLLQDNFVDGNFDLGDIVVGYSNRRAISVNETTGKKELVTIIAKDENIEEGLKNEQTYSANVLDLKISEINTAINDVQTIIIDNKNQKSYQNSVLGRFNDTLEIVDPIDNGRYLIGNNIKTYHFDSDSWGSINPESGMSIIDLSNNNEYLFNGSEWKDKIADDARIVHTAGDEIISNEKTFSDNVVINKNLIVEDAIVIRGGYSSISSKDLLIADNIITINNEDVGKNDGSGITEGIAGFEINRGTIDGTPIGSELQKVRLLFDDNDDLWKIGFENEEKPMAVIDDQNNVSLISTYSNEKIEETISKLSIISVEKELENVINVGDVIYVDPMLNKADKANCTNLLAMDRIIGIAMENAGSGEEFIKVCQYGVISISGLIRGSIYFLGVNGELTTVLPQNLNNFVNKIGYAISDNVLLIDIGESIKLGL